MNILVYSRKELPELDARCDYRGMAQIHVTTYTEEHGDIRRMLSDGRYDPLYMRARIALEIYVDGDRDAHKEWIVYLPCRVFAENTVAQVCEALEQGMSEYVLPTLRQYGLPIDNDSWEFTD